MTLTLVCLACSKIPTPGVYKIDIQQGNVVTSDMLGKLSLGMEKRKVRFIMGTPLVSHTFSPDRWDYIYSFQEGGGQRSQRHIVLLFEDELLSEVIGDVALQAPSDENEEPTEPETIVSVPDQPPAGLLGGIGSFFDDDDTRVPRVKKEAKPFEVETDTNKTSVSSPNADDEAPESVITSGGSEIYIDDESNIGATSEVEQAVEDENAQDASDQGLGFFERLGEKFDLEPPAEVTQGRD